MSSRSYRDRDSAAFGEINSRDDENDNAEFAPNNGRSCNRNYCRGDRVISKTAVFDLAGPSPKNRWRIKGYPRLIFGIEFLQVVDTF
jgi:hypothetical protein